MKIIYISMPISGHEDTYEQRLDEAVEYVKANFQEYDRIVTPKEIAEYLEYGSRDDVEKEVKDWNMFGHKINLLNWLMGAREL